ncbi:MAG: DNA polymerase III subunit alpha, partial [Firmicutes bacterium]|nr:DNA polymerase III subunit alpha [Bacillota bacterium]
MAFTHLHVHTEYSLLDGAARIKDLLNEAQAQGMTSLAITDHGVMFGVIDFYKLAKKMGIKPILGCEVYTAARTMADRDSVLDRSQGHLVLLAKNIEGYRNLMKIVSAGFTDGFYYKPRVDKELLRKYSSDLIALSGCLAGDIQQKLLYGDYEGAKKEALELREIFGEENFYLELQDQGLEEEQQILPGMIRLHEETGIPFVATNDIHYVRKQDAKAHDVLLCIQTGKTIDDENRLRFSNDQFYMKTEEEMRRIFADFPEAIENTQKIADACDVEITFGQYHLPEFIVPDGKTKVQYFRELCQAGAEFRYGKPLAPDLQERLDYEMTTIENMGYVEYFLIVWDFINYAKSQGIMVGPGRGSAAGSIVSYSLQITNIDPIKYSLIFERFLNPERVSMPDIDIDFCIERRGEVIDYVNEKYGEDKVSQIITFGTMKAKMVVRDVGRAMNMPYAEADAISKMIPPDLKMTLDKALDVNPELKKAYDDNKQVRELIDTARALEGMPRHASTHAAGVVISKKRLDEYVPLYVMDKGIATQFTMTTIEELGLLKMDFLGLRNLTVIRDALAMIKENHGVEIDFDHMTFDDPAIFEIIGSGNTMGIFQLESGGMT